MNGWWQHANRTPWHYLVDGVAVCSDARHGIKPPRYFGGAVLPQPGGGPACRHCAASRRTLVQMMVNGG